MPGGGRIDYVPSLDGLRALAVLAVLLFHADVAWARGGFVGVSIFFTLSGFLITHLLLAEFERSGSIRLREFYVRRARRLLPAAWLVVAAVVIAWPLWSDGQLRRLRGDVWSSLLNVANWRSATSTTSYRDLFDSAPSPLAHYWSLAIEEQIYVVLPLVLVALLTIGGRRALAIGLASLLAASIAASLHTNDFDLAYNGTHVRAGELLAGALLALAVPLTPSRRRTRTFRADAAGFVAIAGLSAAVVTFTLDSSLMRGGFLTVSLGTCIVIWAAVNGDANARVLSVSPLVEIGRRSYGVYLFHWPVFLVLTPERIGVEGSSLLAVRIAVTAACTWASFRWLEQPIRNGNGLRLPGRALVGTAIVGLLVLPVAAAPGATASTETEDLLQLVDDGVIEFDLASAEPTHHVATDRPASAIAAAGSAGSPIATAAPSAQTPIARVLVIGSDATAVGALATVDGIDVIDGTQEGCPIASGDEVRLPDGRIAGIEHCEEVGTRVRRLSDGGRPDVIVVSLGTTDAGLLRRHDDVGFPSDADVLELARRRSAAERQVTGVIERFLDRDVAVVIAWWSGPSVVLDSLERLRLIDPRLPDIARTAAEVRDDVIAAIADVEQPSGMTIVVIGDSTSLHFARAIHGVDGRNVVWAGQEGCPLVRATGYRTHRRLDVVDLNCTDVADKLPPLLDRLSPAAVIAMAGPTELAEHRYDTDELHAPGSDVYADVHRREFARLAQIVTGDGTPLVVVDAPPIARGPFSTRPMTEPERLLAFNRAVDEAASAAPGVTVLRFAEALTRHESEHGSIRADGVHADVESLRSIVIDGLGTELDRAVENAREEIAAATATDTRGLTVPAEERQLIPYSSFGGRRQHHR